MILQVITAISGLILPRIIIPTYGSSTNGLIATISQFISYMTLLEGGVGSVFRASLYAPLHTGDIKKVSGIINEQKRFYRKLGSIFILYIFILCFTLPLFIKTDFEYNYIVGLVLILSTGTFLEYFVSLPYQSLIIADQRIRIVHILGSIVIVLNIIVTVILVRLGASIIIVKAASAIIAILKPIVYLLYVKRHYNLDPKEKPDEEALSQRWYGMVHHFAYYIHRNTDILLLSVFVNTKTVSIYSVYLAIVIGIEKIVTSISGSLNAGIGDVLASNNERTISNAVDCFEFIQSMATTVLFTITAILLLPFIKIYTFGINDANYIQPLFGYILIIAESVYCVRCIYSSISMNGNRFKETQIGAIMESIVNISISFVLLIIFKKEDYRLVAVAIGTLVGMSTRLFFELIYLSRSLIYRTILKALKTYAVCGIIVVFALFTSHILINYDINSAFEWIIVAVKTAVIVSFEALVISYIFKKNILLYILNRVLKRA